MLLLATKVCFWSYYGLLTHSDGSRLPYLPAVAISAYLLLILRPVSLEPLRD
jgi:hypothetical protein